MLFYNNIILRLITPKQRRREQNRIAQRTFRERKDRYIQNLEAHIKMLDASHKDLQASYRHSTNQVNALYTQLMETQGELEYWRCLAQPSANRTVPDTSIPMHLQTHPSTSTPVLSPTQPHNMQSILTRQHIPVMAAMHMQHGHFT